MPITVKDALGATQSIKTTGAGTGGDPFVHHHNIDAVIPGTGATNLGKAIGNAVGATDTGVLLLAQRDDALATLSDAEGDAVPLRVNDEGALHVDIGATISLSGAVDTELTTADLDTGGGTDTRAVVGLVLAESGGGVLVGSANPLPAKAAGDIAHNSADSGNPLKIGGKGLAAIPGAVSDTNRVNAYFDRSGRLMVLPGSQPANAANKHEPASNTAAVITYAAGGAGVSHVISGVAWSYNDDPTGGNLKIEDGSGTTVFSVDITAAGPGFFVFPEPLRGTANTALIITLAAGGASVTGKVNALSKRLE